MAEMSPEEQALVKEITKRFDSCNRTVHKHWRGRWEHFDGLYHNYREIDDAVRETRPKDVYPLMRDAQRVFGHELFIPFSFSTVETVMARLVAHRPRMLILPRNQKSERNVENMRALIDSQQERIRYELVLADVAKSGLMYGLGVQKTGWRRQEVQTAKVVPASFVLRGLGKRWALKQHTEPLVDDPVAEHWDNFDFFWDPFADSIETASWILFRSWRNTGYVLEKFRSGQWIYPEGCDEDHVKREGAGGAYEEAWRGRLRVRGLPSPREKDSDIHEVWEFFDRSSVVTLLDRKYPVSMREEDVWPGRLPSQVYRPTKILNSMVGKGEIEPAEDLQTEINMLRTDRRWNALIKLHTPIFYNEAAVDDPHAIRWGPGEMNPVTGDPRDLIFMPNVGDIPNSGFQEEASLNRDWERTTGISDSSSGADAGAAQTATGVQLVQAAANARIQLKARRLEVEIIKPGCAHWIAMNQRHILEQRDVRLPALPEPGGPERRWSWVNVGPAELAGEFEGEPEGGSTTPENIPQKRQDAQLKLQLIQQAAGAVDARRILVLAMEELGIKNPESYLAPEMHVPPKTLEYIVQLMAEQGVDPAQAEQLVGGALEVALTEEEQQQQNPELAAASQNGARPEQERQVA